jgi:predicted Zn-dependent peptidase
MGKGMSSRLFQEVREKRGLSYDISSRMQFFTDAGMFTVTAGVDPSKEALAVKTIEKEIDKIRSKKVSASELKRIKEFMLGNFRLSHERVVSKLFFYGSTLLSYGRLMTTEEQVEAVKAVSSADVLEVAEAVFDPANRGYSRVVPKIKE